MALLFCSHRVEDFNKFVAVHRQGQDVRDNFACIDNETLRSHDDPNSIATIHCFNNLENALGFRNDPDFMLRLQLAGVINACPCGPNCACGPDCKCVSNGENSDSSECKCGCSKEDDTSIILFTKAQSCSNITERERAMLLIFQETDDWNKWNQVYNKSIDLFKKYHVISRNVYTLPTDSSKILVTHSFGNLKDCIQMSEDQDLLDRMKQCCIESSFSKKMVMEIIN